MPNATLTIIDAKKEHHFHPGFTLVGAGIWSPAQVTERNVEYMPRGGPGALGAPVDIMFAVLIALIPGGVVGSATFAIMAFVPNRRVAEIA